MIPVGHRLRKPTPDEMAHYRNALATHHRRHASAVLPRRITASRAFLAGIEAGLADLASLPTLIVWGDADFAFRAKERQRWEQTFADHRRPDTVLGSVRMLANVTAQLGDACRAEDDGEQCGADGGDQQGHGQRGAARHAEERDFDGAGVLY